QVVTKGERITEALDIEGVLGHARNEPCARNTTERDDQMVIVDRPRFVIAAIESESYVDALLVNIDRRNFTDVERRVRCYQSDRVEDRTRFDRTRNNVRHERIEDEEVLAVDDGDIDRLIVQFALQREGGVDTGKSATENQNSLASWFIW